MMSAKSVSRNPPGSFRSFWFKVTCAFLGHQYHVVKEFNPAERKLGCCRCSGFWGMNDRVSAIIPWSGELEEMYRDER